MLVISNWLRNIIFCSATDPLAETDITMKWCAVGVEKYLRLNKEARLFSHLGSD